MAVLDIIEAPDRRLTTPSAPVERIDQDLLRLLENMLETMYAAPGLGLAAPSSRISATRARARRST